MYLWRQSLMPWSTVVFNRDFVYKIAKGIHGTECPGPSHENVNKQDVSFLI